MHEDAAVLSASLIALQSRHSASIRKTLWFMQQNYVEPITLSQLAAIANLSLLQFTMVFRREVGMPPYRYLSQFRIRKAKDLLEQGMAISVAAAEAGFFDQPHMCRHFKRACGLTPGQYLAAAMRDPRRVPQRLQGNMDAG